MLSERNPHPVAPPKGDTNMLTARLNVLAMVVASVALFAGLSAAVEDRSGDPAEGSELLGSETTSTALVLTAHLLFLSSSYNTEAARCS